MKPSFEVLLVIRGSGSFFILSAAWIIATKNRLNSIMRVRNE